MATNKYSVHVDRINEGLHQAAEIEILAHTISIDSEGSLSITGETNGKVLSAGLWGEVTITPLAATGGRATA